MKSSGQFRTDARSARLAGSVLAYAPDEAVHPRAPEAPGAEQPSRAHPAASSDVEVQAQGQPDDGAAPRVTTSVLVNAWNQSAYIEDCIESLLVQTVLPDEIIVYDDGSSDDTVQRLRRYGSRITLIEGVHGGKPPHEAQAHAIQTAFRRSTGRLIFLLDGDDRFKRGKIETFASVFRTHSDLALIQSPMDKIDQHGRIIGNNAEPRKHVVDHLKHIYRKQDVDLFYPTSSLAFSRSFLEANLPLDFSDGFALWADTRLSVVAPHFGRVLTLAEPQAEWRRHVMSDSIRARCRRLQLRQTVMRTQVFNHFCRTHGLRTISAWKNWRFYLQLLRFTLPDRAYRLFYERRRMRMNHEALI